MYGVTIKGALLVAFLIVALVLVSDRTSHDPLECEISQEK